MRLLELGLKYNTDKTGHGFLDIYDKHFSCFRNKAKKILEIGIWEGESLKIWKEYFPNAIIYGIDIDELYEEERIISFKADQSNRKQLREFIKKYSGDFNLIVDDGGHFHNQQQISFGFLFKYLKPKGIYVIEDLHTSFCEGFGLPIDDYNTTYNVLERFNETGKFKSIYLTKEENIDLEDNVEYCKIFKFFGNNKHITSIIKKV